MNKNIDGKSYSQMLLGGVSLLSEHVEEINDLNVFPVPDGDTGTNMMKTMEGGISEITTEDVTSIGEAASNFSHGVLLGARGNSGVILSQIFAGICEELSKHEVVSAMILADAYKKGVERSYRAVQNPTEGTILTVFREATEYACEGITEESTIEDFFERHIEKAKESLERTKEILPSLQEADVVDSGAAGYLYIAIGMYNVLTGKTQTKYTPKQEVTKINIDLFTRDSVLEFGYCTEFLLRLTTNKVDPDNFDINVILDKLGELGGESIVAYMEGDIVKVHVHTMTPGAILSAMQAYGEFLTLKIENMSVGHSEGEGDKKKKKKKKPYSVVSVATGEGMCALFRELGADEIVAGGQSANPSTEEFLEVFDKCESDNIIVLPNNKNVFLAANQAAEMYKDAKVHIIPSRSLMQGFSALSVITPGITDIDILIKSIMGAIETVIDCEVTKAVRDVTLNGKDIKEGDYIAISGGEIVAVSDSYLSVINNMLDTVDMDMYEIITLFVGKNVDAESRAELTEKLEELYPASEIVVYEGGQEVYDYLIAIE